MRRSEHCFRLFTAAGVQASRAFAIAFVLSVGAAIAQEDSTMEPIPDRWPAVSDPDQRSAEQLLRDRFIRLDLQHFLQLRFALLELPEQQVVVGQEKVLGHRGLVFLCRESQSLVLNDD